MGRERVGLFFGSFNPFHLGHLLCVVDVYNRKLLDNIIIVPAWQNPWKEYTGNFEIRCKMCETMLKEISYFASVSRIEKELKPTYTFEVLEYLKYHNPDKEYFIVGGTDICDNIKKWKNGQWITDNFNFIKVDRLGVTDKKVNGINISSTEIRNMIKNNLCPIPYINLETFNIIKKNKIYDSEYS